MPERLVANTLQEFSNAVAQLQYAPLQCNPWGDIPQGFENQKHNK